MRDRCDFLVLITLAYLSDSLVGRGRGVSTSNTTIVWGRVCSPVNQRIPEDGESDMVETCNEKPASVATDVFGKSGRDMWIGRISRQAKLGAGGILVSG